MEWIMWAIEGGRPPRVLVRPEQTGNPSPKHSHTVTCLHSHTGTRIHTNSHSYTFSYSHPQIPSHTFSQLHTLLHTYMHWHVHAVTHPHTFKFSVTRSHLLTLYRDFTHTPWCPWRPEQGQTQGICSINVQKRTHTHSHKFSQLYILSHCHNSLSHTFSLLTHAHINWSLENAC